MDNYSDVDALLKKAIKAKLVAYNTAVKKYLDKGEQPETFRELRAAYHMPEDVAGFKF